MRNILFVLFVVSILCVLSARAETVAEQLKREGFTQMEGDDCGYRNLATQANPLDDKGWQLIGEIKNLKKNFTALVSFSVAVYDKNGALYLRGKILMGEFKLGQTKTFEASFSEPLRPGSTYKLQYDTGM